jgi:hypothetical protein
VKIYGYAPHEKRFLIVGGMLGKSGENVNLPKRIHPHTVFCLDPLGEVPIHKYFLWDFLQDEDEDEGDAGSDTEEGQ